MFAGFYRANKTKGRDSMAKKHFISLADLLRKRVEYLESNRSNPQWTEEARASIRPSAIELNILIESLADWCEKQNPRFNRNRWLAYVAGTCGPNGGERKK